MNESVPLVLTVLLSLGSGALAALISRWTTLKAVRLANENAQKISQQNNEHSIKLEWIKSRRAMIEKLATEFLETARVSLFVAHSLVEIEEAQKSNNEKAVQTYGQELSNYPSFGQLIHQLQHGIAVSRLLKLDAAQAIADHNNMLMDLLTDKPNRLALQGKAGLLNNHRIAVIDSLANAIA